MARTSRPTQQSAISKAFGGRSGFVSDELDGRGRPSPTMSRWERSAARQSWDDASNHYEVLAAAAVAAVFVGGFAAFITALALTR